MAWNIKCASKHCHRGARAANIVDLIREHRDSEGYFLCSCGNCGYVKKTFSLQEADKTWSPFLRGIITLGERGNTYQPFVFLVSHRRRGRVDSVWFSYYKDLRRRGGRLKLGYGPGGPPVFSLSQVNQLVRQLKSRGCMRA